jgi:hypothetical protein
VTEIDPIEAALKAGAASALRARADRQAKISKDGTVYSDDGSPIRSGEGAIAARVALTLARLAAEFELELSTATAQSA